MFMERIDPHPTREELLLAADGELSHRHAKRVQEHLSACWECRSRTREMEAAIGDYIRLHRRRIDPALPPSGGPRALLKARMHELASTHARQSWHVAGWLTRKSLLAAISAICVAAALGLWMRQERAAAGKFGPGVPAAIPDARLTPGVAVHTRREDVCRESPPKNKLVSESVQRRVFAAYGISNRNPEAYEVDYLITPALGGSDDIRNLWPQPYSSTIWNARVKDDLEDRLYHLVCAGGLDLATAQRAISTDWIAAYKYYLHTSMPIEELRQPGGVRH